MSFPSDMPNPEVGYACGLTIDRRFLIGMELNRMVHASTWELACVIVQLRINEAWALKDFDDNAKEAV